jgi:serine/threonine protein kinase
MPPSSPDPGQPRLKFLPTKATFRLGDALGVGTVGTVYRAHSDDVEGPVAVKILHPNIAHDQQIVDRFQREIMIMERMNHPHIVRHYGGGMMDGQYFYAMQLLEHGSLKDRLRQHGALPWPQAAAYAAQIASALQHAHNHGITHRDLKPSNLFFGDDGRVVLGDFGIAYDGDDSDITGTGITVGTYAYMAPEQICADREISGKSDLYSLGCVLYEMLTGKPPYTGANFAQIWDQHLHSSPTPLAELGIECPSWLTQLLDHLLQKDPEQRPFNARAVQGLIKDHLQEEFGDDVGRLTAHLPQLEEHHGPSRTVRMAVVLATLGILLGLAIWLGSQ